MKRTCLLTLLLIAATAVAPAQFHVTIGDGSAGSNGTTIYPAPYGNWYWGSRHQFVITANELLGACIAPNAIITEIAFNVAALNTAQPHNNFTIGIDNTPNPDASVWAPAPPIAFGPVTYMPTLGWNTHILTNAVVWDGISNLLIETCHQNSSFTQNASTTWSNTGFTSSRYYRADAAGVCGNTALTGTSPNRPDIRLTVGSLLSADYQSNQSPAISVLVNNTGGNPCNATTINQQAPAAGTVSYSSNLIGSNWDLAFSTQPLVPASGGALVLVDGQVVNLDVGAPIAFMNNFLGGGGWPGSSLPGANASAIQMNYQIGSAQAVSLQGIINNPASPSGVSLSQSTRIVVQ